MNRILNTKINNNIIHIIGSYLLPDKKFLDIKSLKYQIETIEMRLNDHMITKENLETFYYKSLNNCKITRICENWWSIRPKKLNLNIFCTKIYI